MRPASLIGIVTAATFNPWLIDHFIPANDMAAAQFWVFAGVDVLLVVWSLFILKRPSTSTPQNLLLSTCVGLWFGFGISIADHTIGPRLLEHKKNLVYGAFDKARMQSTEFDITYKMNNLGFRGPITHLAKDERERIMFIGDSFTLGWGVEEEDSWIGQLQQIHQDKELLNLGRGGDHPMDYIQQARRAIPVLNPDKVVICLLAWNDLFQMNRVMKEERGQLEIHFESKDSVTGKRPFIIQVYRHFYPNISSVFPTVAQINNRWHKETEWLLSQMSADQQVTYESASDEVRSAFESYRLNPWIVYDGVFHSNSYAQACSGEMDEALERISHHLIEFEELAEKHDCELEFLMLPYRPANCPNCIEDLNGLGYQLDSEDDCPTESIIELPLRQMISTPIHFFDSHLHDPNEVHSWYFPLDGHLNETGNLAVAQWANTVLFQ